LNAFWRADLDFCVDNFVFKRAKDNHSELDLDIGVAGAVSNESIRRFQQIVHADAKADLGHDLVRIFLVDFVLNLIPVLLVELVRWNLNQIRERR